MSEFQSTRAALPEMAVWEPQLTRAEQDMEALRRSASRFVGGLILLAFAATAAAYVWHVWLSHWRL